ncbi:unnamed protein product [Candida verbasci]|uniref:Alkyl transferase n=1 Tax=Candida verbasci TaxID=1227364 RepID=A0A9W4XCG3_9ASCO|nr:unnamed protein product [Candida verbasci]
MALSSNPLNATILSSLFLKVPIFAYIIGFFQDFVFSILKTGPIPRHVAFVMDGNRTYAKNHRLPLKEGHFAGANSLVKILEICYKSGISQVTIYAFSLENFNRSKDEVDILFGLLRDKLKLLAENEDSYTRFNKIRIKIIGNKSFIPPDILKDLEHVEQITQDKASKKTLNVCFPYTARDEITYAIKSIAEKRINGEILKRDDINLKTIENNFYFGDDVPPLDILVRTSGHTRLSDFLLWQCNTNCTIEFPDTLWPEFGFISMVSILFKWSYYTTLRIEEEIMDGKNLEAAQQTQSPVLLRDLPQPPPATSVSKKK